MPDRLYRPHHKPPTVGDRIMAHWAETVCAVMSVVVGIIIVCGSIFPPFIPSPALDSIPDWQAWLIGIFMAGGGGLWGWSILRWFGDLADQWWVQRTGAAFCGLGWTSYALAAIAEHPEHPVSWVAGIALAAICWGCVWLSVDFERVTRKASPDDTHPVD